MIKLEISKEELNKIKSNIFEEYISSEEKESMENLINIQIDEMLDNLESENVPIDE